MSKQQHTPGPWKAVRDEVWVGKRRVCPHVTAGEQLPIGQDYERGCANARHIVRCVNSHDDLLAALKLARDIIGHPDDESSKIIDAAIKRAEGEA